MMDLILMSFAKNKQLWDVTQHAIDTAIASEPEGFFNIIVVESNKAAEPFNNANTIYPAAEFGYNRYLNIGAAAGNAK
jgi:hypothetical protein